MNKISCIIPAYNEEKRIGTVLEAVSKNPLISEVIVVDDHSSDQTKSVVEKFPGVTLIAKGKNAGKSKAIYDGIKKSTGDIIVFLDADLVGITSQNVSDLVRPLIDNQADISISLRKNTPFLWKWIGLDYISGERAMRKSFFSDDLEKIPALANFGLEVFMNRIIIKNNLRVKVVGFPNVLSPFKYKKSGFVKGMSADMLMIRDIFRTVPFFEAMQQIYKIRGLRA